MRALKMSRASRLHLASICITVVLRLLIDATAVLASGRLVALPEQHPADVVTLAAEGSASATRVLHLQLHLATRHAAALERLLGEQQDPRSPRYHQWLTAAEYDARFSARPADVAHVTGWLVSRGLRVTSAGPTTIGVEGNVATVQRAFGVKIAGSRDGRYFGNVGDPRLPASMAAKVDYVEGLHNLSATVMHTTITDPTNNDGITAPHFGPTDVHTYANEGPLLQNGMDGTGQCIAALEGSDVDQASLADFNTVFGLPAFVAGQNFDTVYPDGAPGIAPPVGNASPAYAEAAADIEYAHGIAPGATIVLYAGNYPSLGTNGLVDTLKAAVTDNRCAVITISWAQCGEPKAFFKALDHLYKRGAAQGQSIFVATGDVGVGAPGKLDRATGGCSAATKPAIEENAGSPNVTAVGATAIYSAEYDANGNDTGVGSPAEVVWGFDILDHRFRSASTGGVSKIFPKPKYQKKVKGVKLPKRGVPDVSIAAGGTSIPGFWECFDFGLYRTGTATGPVCLVGGGTSLAAPQWAGVAAIMGQKKGVRLGNLNTQIYAMAEASLANLTAVGIRDVTQGDNGWYPIKGYTAKPGFDLASGWGSIDIATFANAFVAFQPRGK